MPDLEFIKRGIFYAYEKICDESLGAIQIDDCRLVFCPRAKAIVWGSEEVRTYLKHSEYLAKPPFQTLYGFRYEVLNFRYFTMAADGNDRRLIERPTMTMQARTGNNLYAFTIEIAIPL